jgi:hypothetical protein
LGLAFQFLSAEGLLEGRTFYIQLPSYLHL